MTAPAIEETILLNEEYVELLLSRRLGSRIRNLRILLQPNGIILQGRAATYHAKQLAQHAVMEMVRRPILANEIEVC